MERLCAKLNGVHVNNKIYLLDGLVFYDLEEDKWILNEKRVLQWHPVFRQLHVNRLFCEIGPKILQTIPAQANQATDFAQSHKNLLQAYDAALLMCKQLLSLFGCVHVSDMESEVEGNHIKIGSVAFTPDFDPLEVILEFDVANAEAKWSVHQWSDCQL